MKKLQTIGLLIAICCLYSPIFSQTTYYVDASMPDNTGNGTSWLTAKKDVQDAIDSSSPGDQIWVKSGVYIPKNYPATLIPLAETFPVGSPVLPLTDRHYMFFMKNNLKIYGGFAGTETNINQRTNIFGSNKTTFSGDVGTVGDSTDNCYHILVYLAPDAGAVAPTIDGIHFEGGCADRNYGQSQLPGAAFGSAFSHNIRHGFGGAVYLNLGNNGKVNQCSFTKNYTANRGAGVWFDGGFGTTRKFSITNSFFYENVSSTAGYGAGAAFNHGENTLSNNVFYANSTGSGSAIMQFAGEFKAYSNTFVKNKASGSGTIGLYNNGDSAIFYNNLFYQNISGNVGLYTNSFGADFEFPGTYYTTPNPVFGGANLGYTWDNIAKNNALELTAAEHNNTTYDQARNDLGTGAVGNIFSQNPNFQDINDIDGADNVLGTADDGLILGITSPVINMGDSTLAFSATGNFDISNFDRIDGANINMGAYERTWAPCYYTLNPTVTACDSFSLNGTTYTLTGIYTDTIFAAACDTIINLNLTVNHATTSTIVIDTCQAFVMNGQLFTTSGTYTQIIPNTQGCDSTINLTATIAPLTNSITIDSCQTVLINSQLYTTSGTYTQTLTNVFGCDSILTINLTITPITGSITVTECGSATINGQVYSTTAIYTQTLIANDGCDSTLTIDVTIVPLPNLSVAISNSGVFCENEQITLTGSGASILSWDNGVVDGVSFYPLAGINLYTLTGTENGCTTTLQVPVTVGTKPTIEATVSATSICENDSVYFSGNGALVYNYLTPDFSYAEWFTPTTLGTNTYTMEGIGVNGCRDTVSVSFELRDRPAAPGTSALTASTCYGHPVSVPIMANASSGIIEWFFDANLTNSHQVNNILDENELITGTISYFASNYDNNCYSPGTEVQITVFALPTVDAGTDVSTLAHETITLTGIVSNTADSYWTNTLNSTIDSALTVSFLTTSTEEYTLQAISADGCLDSSKVLVSIDKPFVSSNYVSANGDGNNDTWQIQPLDKINGCTVRIYNTFGAIIFETENYQNDWSGADYPDGDYYYEISCGEEKTVGSITLIH
jgi:gliding motility-associated-like protein